MKNTEKKSGDIEDAALLSVVSEIFVAFIYLSKSEDASVAACRTAL